MHDERPTDPREITRLLAAWSGGDALAAAELSEIAYAQIHKLAQAQLRRAPGAHTLQPTELAHELFVKLLGSQASWNDRRHFYASVALAMRRLLVDAARARRSEKRGGDQLHVTLSAAGEVPIESDDAEALDGIFDELRAIDPRKAEIIEATYLLGLTRQEIAAMLEVSFPTVDRDLRFARAWLKDRLARG